MIRKSKLLVCWICLFLTVLSAPLRAFAITPEERVVLNQGMPVESNQIPGWPQGPVVSANSAILMELSTGTILYEKNIHAKHYPASITKLLTTLIALEQCSLEETVSFSKRAVFSIPYDSNHIAMDVGDTLTMEQCLNAILIRSANEVSYAVAEHVAGSFEDFAVMMNERAKELGCVDSNFVNPNGLPDENHYTSAYDMAKIGQAFFSNDLLCKISMTKRLVIPKGEETLIENTKMEIIPGLSYGYDDLVGCKTGYTSDARYTLAACAERNGLRLIAVVMEDEYIYHYNDIKALFEYGFQSFEKISVAEHEKKYNINSFSIVPKYQELFAKNNPMLTIPSTDTLILPKTISFSQLQSTVEYQTASKDGPFATIYYDYEGIPLGQASLIFSSNQDQQLLQEMKDTVLDLNQEEEALSQTTGGSEQAPRFFFINWRLILLVAGILLLLVLIGSIIRFIIQNYHFHLPFQRSNKISRERRQAIQAAKKRYKYRKRRR